jgi:hypothetical protein
MQEQRAMIEEACFRQLLYQMKLKFPKMYSKRYSEQAKIT